MASPVVSRAESIRTRGLDYRVSRKRPTLYRLRYM